MSAGRTGTIALHGGGEFLPGDERFLAAVLARADSGSGSPRTRSLRVVVVPTAAARGRPDLAGANGVNAISRTALAIGLCVDVFVVSVVDRASADDERSVAILAEADLIYLPGGDPDLIPGLYPGTAAWTTILEGLERGAVLAGASAGAMALGSLAWTPSGLVPGLGCVPNVIVLPHVDERTWAGRVTALGRVTPGVLGILGLGERTGVLIGPNGPWRVVGEAEVRWLAPGQADPSTALVLRDGATIESDALTGAGA